MQEKIEDREIDSRLELAEERLKLAESELLHARERIEELERNRRKSTPTPPPCIPPPPPPPPPPISGDLICTTSNPKLQIRKSSKPSLISLVDKPSSEVQIVQNGIENIVNQIKGGQFTLKSTKKVVKERQEPQVVNEMLKILGTLRRSPMTRKSLLLTHGTTDF